MKSQFQQIRCPVILFLCFSFIFQPALLQQAFASTANYTYNPDSIRVRAEVQGGTTTDYLIDPYNHTGYAQVFKADVAGDPNTVYILGHDVLGQAKGLLCRYFLYDGHGSVRQFTTKTSGTVIANYAYDAYGNALFDASNASTRLLYAGEMYDQYTQQYYLRARYYSPTTGRFNRIDPFAGNNRDPQSLHKYLYAHANPINSIDPSGKMEFSLSGMFITAMIAGTISGTMAGTITAIKGGTTRQVINSATTWFWRGFAVGATVYGGIWATHSILVALYGASAGLGNLQYAREYGIKSFNSLREAVRGTGLFRHHIIEQRFAGRLGLKIGDMASIIVNRTEHQMFTNKWRDAIGYIVDYSGVTRQELWFHAQRIYEEYPALLDAARAQLGM